jgi:ABC-type spermidine/putrescine transport system permease subunit II
METQQGSDVRRFVRALLVVLETKAVEGTLLGFSGAGRWRGGGAFEREMHALVAAHFCWRLPGSMLVFDAEFEPTDGELREARRSRGGEGRAIVGANGIRQPEGLERA